MFQSIPAFFEDAVLSFESFGAALQIGDLLTGFQLTVEYIGSTPLTELAQTALVFDPFDFFAPPITPSVNGPAPTITVSPFAVNAPASSVVLFFAAFAAMLIRTRKHRHTFN